MASIRPTTRQSVLCAWSAVEEAKPQSQEPDWLGEFGVYLAGGRDVPPAGSGCVWSYLAECAAAIAEGHLVPSLLTTPNVA
jgi:hypothetical protein